jgi:ABC-type multidrug transport system permease subunit
VFASSVFVPVETFPSWLQGFAQNQPITVMTDALRGLMLGEGVLPSGVSLEYAIGLSLVWVVGIVAVAAPAAVWLYRRATG